MSAGKRSPSARERTEQPLPAEPPPYLAYIASDAQGRLRFLDHQAVGAVRAGGSRVFTIDIGRPYDMCPPSSFTEWKAGMVIEGMTGINAKPWTASKVHAGARLGWFGFRLID